MTKKRIAKFLSKSLVVFLVFMFFITPVAPVFAFTADADTGSDSVSSEDVTILSQDAITPPDSVTNLDDSASVTDGQNDTSVGQPNVVLGGSSISNTPPQALTNNKTVPQADLTTGALTYVYPIVVPPGRNGMQPDLKLQYNSQDTAQDSVFGYGWSLNIPSITRVNKKGTNTLFTDNYFSSSLSGELVNISGDNYAPKVETGEFLKYTYASNTWIVTDKNGIVYTFGLQSPSRQDNGNNATIYKWMLEKVQDTNGNYITYTYYKLSGQIYPDTITYTGNGADAGIFSVSFGRESRTDILTTFASAFAVTTDYRISQIQTSVSGVIRNKYTLSYTAGDNGKRSLLQSVTQTGYDTNGTATTLPATSFSYTAHQGDIFNVDNGHLVNGLSNLGNTSKGIIAGNVDSDAYPDIVKAYEAVDPIYSVDKRTYVFNPATDSFSLNTAYTPPNGIINFTDSSGNIYDGGTRLLDANGDGKNDLMRTPYAYGPVPDKEINNGNGWTQIPNSDPKYTVNYVSNPNYTLFSNDLNGDGLIDYIQDSGNFTSYSTKTSLNNGFGFDYYNNGSGYYSATPDFTGGVDSLMFDINGDNLPDIIKSIGNQSCGSGVCTTTYVQKIYINNGNSWQLDTSYALPPNFAYLNNGFNGSFNTPVLIADFNNDGLQDMLILGATLYLNQGKSFIESHLSNDMMSAMGNSLGGSGTYPDYLFLDLNADGAPDFMRLNGDYAYFDTVTTHTDLLKSITLSAGGKSDITYKSSAQYKDSNNNLLNPKLPFVVETVNTITTTNPVNNIIGTDSYVYKDGYYYFDTTNPFTRKFAGFGIITKTDSVGNVTKTYFHQDDYFKIGKAYRTEQYDSSSHIYSKTINKWDSVDLGADSKFVKLGQTVNYTYDGDAGHRDIAESYAYDNSGNMTQKIQWGEVIGGDDGNFTDVGADKFATDYTYATNGLASQFKTSSQRVTNQVSIKVKESLYYYDSLGFGSLTKGNVTRQENWKKGRSYINNQKTYNAYGLVVSSVDPRGNTTQYAYDTYNLYPATITNALNQAEQYVYDYVSGQITQKTNINGRVFQNTYDGLGRLTEEKQPDLTNPLNLVTGATHIYTDTSNALAVKTSTYLDAFNTVDSYTYFDGLGRKIQERQETEGSNFSVKDTIYNNLGQVSKESLPYFSLGANKTPPTNDQSLYANYGYDAVGRLISSTNSVGTTLNSYNDWKLTTTDANGKYKDLYKDAYGNLVQVSEHNAGSTYSTFYNYNYFGSITKITDALNNVRNFTYNGLGERVTAQDLHNPNDSIFGTWSYVYDSAGNLSQVIDPKSQTTNYTYDNLNRQLTEDFTGQSGIEVINTYDVGVDGRGHLTYVMSPVLAQNYEYNALGFVKNELKAINNIKYETFYEYDRQGNVTHIVNPDNSELKNSYNSAGLLDQVQRKESFDADFASVVSGINYAPTGQVASMHYANGVLTTNTYDASKLYRLQNKKTILANGTYAQNITYTYDKVGNIMLVVDASATDALKYVKYSYDDLYRLISASATDVAPSQDNYMDIYVYDAIGNILSHQETIGDNLTIRYVYTYGDRDGGDYANPHAVSSINDGNITTNYLYDNNGNMIKEGDTTYTFDYNNRLVKSYIPDKKSTITYDYDTAGQRIKLFDGTTTTAFPTRLYNTAISKESSKTTKHLFANGQAVATIEKVGDDDPQIYYTSTDQLNSSSIVTDGGSMIAEVMDYFPFGSLRLDQAGEKSTFSEQRKYIGQEFDEATGLNYLNARYYNSNIGRFISQDPMFWGNQNLLDPQSLNSYSYGNNNPIINSDPTGKNAMLAQTLLGAGIGFEGMGTIFDATIFGAPIGIALGITGIGIIAVGGGVYYFDKIQSNHAKGNSGVAGKTTTGAPNSQIPGNNQNGKKDENSNKNNNWGDQKTLEDHFNRHGSDFGAKSPEDYANKANEWINNAKNDPNVESFVSKNGNTNYFDSKNSIRAATNKEGKTATFFKSADSYQGRNPIQQWEHVKNVSKP